MLGDLNNGGSPLRDEESVLLRYLYNDSSLQAAMPLRVIADEPRYLVGWLGPSTPIMYWATADGRDPREVPLGQRFHQPLTTAARRWQGPGVLRVMPTDQPYQVIHFWNADDTFAGWYVNFEAPRIRDGSHIDTVDWHLDLWIDADLRPRWKDEDEAAAALQTWHLRSDDYELARSTGEAIISNLQNWPGPIGDWRTFRPDPDWPTLLLPDTNKIQH